MELKFSVSLFLLTAIINAEPNHASLPFCSPGPYPDHAECQTRLTWLENNWETLYTEVYKASGIDGTQCSLQRFLAYMEERQYCPPCICDDEIQKNQVLVWSDEFDTFDSSKWNREELPPGKYNNELQQYTSSTRNAFVEDGKLVIRAMNENGVYTSARITSQNKGDFKYGRFEIKAKLPLGEGLWPALWMLPTYNKFGEWPKSGEIDIMEHVTCNIGTVLSTVHTGSYNHLQGTHIGGSTLFDETIFHVFAIEWTEEKIEGFVDDEKYFTFVNDGKENSDTWPFDEEFHFVMNIAVGGDLGGSCLNGATPSLPEPSDMIIDYVRVYRFESGNGNENLNSANSDASFGQLFAITVINALTLFAIQ